MIDRRSRREKKRVLIFSLAYIPHTGGAEVAIKEITDRIPDIEFHAITLNFGGEAREEKIGNVLVHRVGSSASYLSKIVFAPRAARRAAQLQREHPFDAFWAMMSYMLFPIVLLARRGISVPYVLTLQEGDPWGHVFNRWFMLPLRPLLVTGFRHAAVVQTISTYLAHWARRMGYHGEIAVIPNGVDSARFAVARRQGPHSQTTLVTTSRLVRKNAVDDVIRALAFLPDTVRFVIYGSGPEEAKLRKLADTLSVAARIQFAGHIDHADVPRALAACDIFVRPSRSEGMGNSFIEAMAAGVPVIATQEGGIADFLFDAKRNPDKPTTGWAVDRDSPKHIAEAVTDILGNLEHVARVTANAKNLVREKYDWDTIAARMRALFDTASARQARMRIVIAAPLYPPEIGGPATYAKLLVEGLPVCGIGVELVTFNNVRRLPKLIRHYAYYRRVLRATRHADAILALDPVSVGLPALLAAKKARKPFAVKIAGDYAWEQGRQRFGIVQTLDEFVRTEKVPWPVRMLWWIEASVARSATLVIVPSEYLKSIIAAWRIPEEKIEVIYNAAPLRELGTVPEAVAALPRPLVVTAGRLVPWKNITGVIEAVAQLDREGRQTSLTIVGDGPERMALARRAQEELPRRSVLTGMLPRRDTLAVLACADVFVLNSSYEGLPHLLIEALALGVPVIATAVGGNAEIISDGDNGLLVPAGDTPALRAVLKRVLRHEELRARLSARALESSRRFSPDAMLSRTADILRGL